MWQALQPWRELIVGGGEFLRVLLLDGGVDGVERRVEGDVDEFADRHAGEISAAPWRCRRRPGGFRRAHIARAASSRRGRQGRAWRGAAGSAYSSCRPWSSHKATPRRHLRRVPTGAAAGAAGCCAKAGAAQRRQATQLRQLRRSIARRCLHSRRTDHTPIAAPMTTSTTISQLPRSIAAGACRGRRSRS